MHSLKAHFVFLQILATITIFGRPLSEALPLQMNTFEQTERHKKDSRGYLIFFNEYKKGFFDCRNRIYITN